MVDEGFVVASRVVTGVSVGVALAPDDGEDAWDGPDTAEECSDVLGGSAGFLSGVTEELGGGGSALWFVVFDVPVTLDLVIDT